MLSELMPLIGSAFVLGGYLMLDFLGRPSKAKHARR